MTGQGNGAARLLGRAAECALLDRTVAAVRAGESRVLVVRGEAGVGKTALLDHAVAAAGDALVLRAGGTESETELPFATLHQLAAPLLDRAATLPLPRRAALETVFGIRAGPPPDRFLVGLAALSLLTGASERRPLLCVVDDAHWMDRASGQVLSFVARRLLAESIGLLFGTRRDNPALIGLPELAVGGLADADARALLDSATPGGLDRQVRDRIVAETRGNPFALLDLPRGLSATEVAGGLGLPRPDTRVVESTRAHIAVLPEPVRLLLLVAAAEPVGDPVTVWRAAEVLGLAPATALVGGTDGLLTVDERVRFRHPLARSAVYRSAGPADRRAVHLALARVTGEREAPDRRAWHLASAASGPDEQVAADLERTAGRAQARAGVAARAAFLQRAVALTAESGPRAARALAAADAGLRAGDVEAAHRFAGIAGQDAPGEEQRARAGLVLGRVALASGRAEHAAGLLLAAARRLGAFDPAAAREAYLVAWAAAAARGDPAQVSAAIRDLPVPHGPPGVVDLFLSGCALLGTDEPAAAVGVLRRATAALVDQPAAHREPWSWAACGLVAAVWDDAALRTVHARAAAVAREGGMLAELPFCLASLGTVLARSGDLTGADDLAAQAARVAGGAGGLPAPDLTALLVGLRGREEQFAPIGAAGWPAAILYNGLGRYEQALPFAHACARSADPGPAGWVLPELVEAAARTGDEAGARAALDDLAAVTRPCGTDWALGVLARCRALLADGPEADTLYREAIARLARTGLRPELARAHLLRGEWLRRDRRRAEAREHLRTAYRMFSAIGMAAFADRAHRELRTTGETARKRKVEAPPGDELTAQERQIALLVGDGFSNPEVAARLFLSPRTVEWHLGKIFAKLAITSRRQLREAVAGPGRSDADSP